MSREIDERIVEMQFDNQEFEKRISTTQKSLDKLREKLKLDDAGDSFNSLQQSINRLNFSNLIDSSTIAIAKLRIVTNVMDDLYNKGKRMVKELTVAPVSSGWQKYADITTSTQTIMAATAKDFENEAEQIKVVNDQLSRLNWFTDETSYSLTDMTNNIGKFTSNGVKLETAVTAMQGIATWAARSGANSGEAARAMYNLSQALAVGSVKLIDWKSIENANMATKEFKDLVIDTAVAMGTLQKNADGTIFAGKHEVSATNFNEALSEGWFSSDVLLSVLNQYGGFTNKLHDYVDETGMLTSEMLQYVSDFTDPESGFNLEAVAKKEKVPVERLKEMLTELSSAEYELGRKAFAAAQEAKTFEEAISSVKDAASTGWMQSFKTIFGDYTEAKELWTTVANELYDVFAEPGNFRNEILENWVEREVELGKETLNGRKLLLKAFGNLWDGTKEIVDVIKTARDTVFFPGLDYDGIVDFLGEKLFKFTKAFQEFTSQFKLTDEMADRLRTSFERIFNTVKHIATPIINIGKNVIATGAHIVKVIAPAVFRIFEIVTEIFDVVSGVISKITNSAIGGIFDLLNIAIDKLVEGIRRFGDFLSNIKVPSWVQGIVDSANAFWNAMKNFGGLESIKVDIEADKIDDEIKEASKAKAQTSAANILAKDNSDKVLKDSSLIKALSVNNNNGAFEESLNGLSKELKKSSKRNTELQTRIGYLTTSIAKSTKSNSIVLPLAIDAMKKSMSKQSTSINAPVNGIGATNGDTPIANAAVDVLNKSKSVENYYIKDFAAPLLNLVGSIGAGFQAMGTVVASIPIPEWLQPLVNFGSFVITNIGKGIEWVANKLASIKIPQWMIDAGDFFKEGLKVFDIFGGSDVEVSEMAIPEGKTIPEMALEVITGIWGNDPERYDKLLAAGYDADSIQEAVNDIFTVYGNFVDGWESILEEKWGGKSAVVESSIKAAEAVKESAEESTETPKKLTDYWQDFKEWISGLRDKFLEKLPEIMYNLGVAFATVKVKIGEFGEWVNDKLGKAITFVGEKITKYGPKVKKWLSDAWKVIKMIIPALTGKFDNLDELNELLTGGLGNKSLNKIKLPKFIEILVNLRKKVISLGGTLKTFGSNIWGFMVRSWPYIQSKIEGLWNKIKSIAGGAKEIWTGTLSPIFGSAFETLKTNISNLFDGKENLSIEDIVNNMPDIFGSIKEFFMNIGTDVATAWENADGALGTIKEAIGTIIDSIVNFGSWIVTQISTLLGVDMTPEEIPLVGLLQSLASVLASPGDIVNNGLDNIYSSFGTGAAIDGSGLDKFIDILTNFTSSDTSEVQEGAENFSEGAITALQSLQGVTDKLKEAANGNSEASKAIDDVDNILSLLIGEDTNPFKKMTGMMKYGGVTGMMDTITNDLVILAEEAPELSKGMLDVANQELTNLPDGATFGQYCNAWITAFDQAGIRPTLMGIVQDVATFTDSFSAVNDETENASKTTFQTQRMFKTLNANVKIVANTATAVTTVGLMKSLSNFFKGAGIFFENIGQPPKKSKSTAILEIAIAIAGVVAVIIWLSKQEMTKVDWAVQRLGAILGTIILFYLVMRAIGEAFDKNTPDPGKIGKGAKNTALLAGSMFAIAASVLMIYAAVKLWNNFDIDKDFRGLFAVILIIAFLIGVLAVITHNVEKEGNANKLFAAAIAVVAIAAAIVILSYAVIELGKVPLGELAIGMIAVIVMIVVLTKTLQKVNGTDLKGAGAILAIAVAVDLLVLAVSILGNMELPNLVKGVLAIGVLLLMLSKTMKSMAKVTSLKGVVSMIIAVIMLAAIVGILNSMQIETTSFLVIKSIGYLMKALASMMETMGKLPWNAGFKAILNIGEMIIGLLGIIAAIAAIDWVITGGANLLGIETESAGADIIKRAIPVFEALGELFGALVHGLLKGLLGGGGTKSITETFQDFGAVINSFIA